MNSTWLLILLAIGVIGAAMLAMAVGAIVSNRCLRGSCGGPDLLGPKGETLTCDTCPLRTARRREPPAAGTGPLASEEHAQAKGPS